MDIRIRVARFINDADSNPLSIVLGQNIYSITSSDIRQVFSGMAGAPLSGFRILAQIAADMLNANYTLLVAALGVPDIQRACSNTTAAGVDLATDAKNAIACSDASDALGHDVEFYANYVQQLKDQSPTVGEPFSRIRYTCAGWKVPAKWRFDGPFTTPPPNASVQEGYPLHRCCSCRPGSTRSVLFRESNVWLLGTLDLPLSHKTLTGTVLSYRAGVSALITLFETTLKRAWSPRRGQNATLTASHSMSK